MTQEEEQLLLKDLCCRLPYGVIVNNPITSDDDVLTYSLLEDFEEVNFDYPKPYLRPMSSMTEEERNEYLNIDNRSYSCPMDYAHIPASDRIDWLLKNHFDFRGLIPMGLAIEVTKENNPYEA